jgi:hypothetical protein
MGGVVANVIGQIYNDIDKSASPLKQPEEAHAHKLEAP